MKVNNLPEELKSKSLDDSQGESMPSVFGDEMSYTPLKSLLYQAGMPLVYKVVLDLHLNKGFTTDVTALRLGILSGNIFVILMRKEYFLFPQFCIL